ncbi:MAG: urease accessory protein UreE [Verrucomicrobia bacterium]|nr:urease accessory protein UreE [Verrucomicrobiota bacterium]
MLLIQSPVVEPDSTLPEVGLRVERRTLAKRLWRGVAEDGTEFGFELAAPLIHEVAFFQNTAARYVIRQEPEPVLEIALDLPPSAAAGVGWAVGNLHLEFSSEPARLLTPDEPAARQLFDRIRIAYRPTTAIFRAGRFARGASAAQPHELGSSHKH